MTPVSSSKIDTLLEGKLFRLHSRLEIASVTKNEIKIINLNTEAFKLLPLPSSDRRGEIVSLIEYATNSLALLSLNQDGLYFELFELQESELRSTGEFQTDLGRIILNPEVLNYKEAVAFVKEELSSMTANMLVASVYEPYSKTLKLNLSFRKPMIETTAVDIDRNTKKIFFKYSFSRTTGSRAKFFANINLDTQALAQTQVSTIGPGEFTHNFMSGELNNNSYNVNALLLQSNSFVYKNNTLKVSIDSLENQMEDFCQIKGLFSDKLVSYSSKDLNARFNGVTALINSIDKNDYESVIDLIGKGADINKMDVAGFSPLDHAVRIGSFKIIKTLVENGADFYNLSRGKSSLTALMFQRFLRNASNLDSESLKLQADLFRKFMNILKKNGYRIDKDSFGITLQLKRAEIKNKSNIDILE